MVQIGPVLAANTIPAVESNEIPFGVVEVAMHSAEPAHPSDRLVLLPSPNRGVESSLRMTRAYALNGRLASNQQQIAKILPFYWVRSENFHCHLIRN